MSFDIATLDEAKERRETGVEIPLLHPKTGKETGAFLTLAAYSSERVKARAREIAKEWEERRSRNPKFMPGLDDQERMTKAMAHAVVIGWRGINSGGKDWPCTPENIERLLSDPVVAGQVDAVAGDEARFFGG